jgi:phosphonate transport system substrate-binding protein
MRLMRSLWFRPSLALALAAVSPGPVLAQDPAELEIGFVPSLEAGALVEDIQPLADYLSEALGMPVRGKVTSSYAALVTAMQIGQTHVGALPPLGMIQAVDIAGAELILQSQRFGSPDLDSLQIIRDAVEQLGYGR